MLKPEEVQPKYLKYLYLTTVISLLFYFLAIEDGWLFPIVFIPITFGYWYTPCWIRRDHEKILFLVFLTIWLGSILVQGDALYATGNLMVAFCLTFFYRDKTAWKSYVNLLPFVGLMIMATFFSSSMLYMIFFLLAMIWSSYLLFYTYLYHLPADQHAFTPEIQISEDKQSLLPETHYRARNFLAKTALTFLMLLLIILGFLIVPRTSWEIYMTRNTRVKKQAGFAEKIESGTVSDMMYQQNVYFTVETPYQTPSYFRGLTFDYYDGHSWDKTGEKQKRERTNRIIDNKTRERQSVLSIGPQKSPPHLGNYYREKYTIKEYRGTTLFYRGDGQALHSPYMRFLHNHIFVDDTGSIELPRKVWKRFIYTVWTDKDAPHPTYLSPKDPKWQKRYLQLPEIGQPVKELAVKLAKGTKNRREHALRVVDYLHQNYQYTLSMNPGNNEWTEYFLFQSGKGYCIHFASAMTVLMRLQGVPARMVGGFLGKHYNKKSKMYVITNEEAHAWVEVYFPNRGWVRFDPTPPQENYLSGMEFWKDLYYQLRSLWFNYVIGFSYFHQRIIYNFIKDLFFRYWWGFFIIAALYLFRKLRHKVMRITWRRAKTHREKQDQWWSSTPSFLFYGDMIEYLKKIGLERAPSDTPNEFARKVKQSYPQLELCVITITDGFCHLRFGHQRLENVAKEMEKQLTELRGLVDTIIEQQNCDKEFNR